MLNLIQLEIGKNKINTFILANVISSIGLLAFIYFVAFVAQQTNEIQFQNYANIHKFTILMGMIVFSTISSVMYTRFIIEEYKGKQMTLLFSYPVNRKKVLLVKLLIVSSFTTVAMIICSAIPIIIFSLTEKISPIVPDTLSQEDIFSTLLMIVITAFITSMVALIAMRIGFIKKSVPITIISSFGLIALLGNTVASGYDNPMLGVIILVIIAAIGILVSLELMQRVNRMEID
ncbi:ABC transporter permease [Bacillus pseudomycoides]|uniref:ABC transporter permease n=1 Tax=Bacillus TaxID=1386 RepID=UPI002248C8E7|nr:MULTISPECIES: ABC transporter permease [Bacillus]MCX2829697.1 ABC transporter permease [Bacillus sp. DHT2]MDR4918848.1 ABC transporter permease [Bacillus pseudomycoides]